MDWLKMTKYYLVLLVLWTAFSQEGAAQNQSLMDGPVRSESTGLFDVEMIRTAISISESAGAVPGLSFIHATSSDFSGGRLQLSAPGIRISRVSMHGYVLEWNQTETEFWIDLPERRENQIDVYEWLIKVDFLIEHGLNYRSGTKGRFAVWNGIEPGSDAWYPTPYDPLDSYMNYLRVTVPKFWEVWVGDGDGLPHPERTTDGYSKRPVFAGASSFLAFDARQSHPDDFDIPVLMKQTNGVSAFIDELNVVRDEVSGYVTTLGLEHQVETFRTALIEGIKSPVTVGNQWIGSPEHWISGDTFTDRFALIHAVITAHVDARFEAVPPTDLWLRSAIPNWLALQVFESNSGLDATGLIYERLRDQYLAESATYRRPLVWDRWVHVQDMLDAHASGKGVWVLRMIAERIGSEAMEEAIALFLDDATEEIVDTESFRNALEVVSGDNLSKFFDVWVYSAGHPELSLSYTFNATTETADLTIRQEQSGQLIPDAFEVDLTFQYSSLEGTNTSMIRLSERNQNTALKTGLVPRYVFPDAFASVLLDYATPLKQDDLVAQLRDAVGPTSKIRSLRHLVKTNPDPTVLLGLRLFLQQENEPGVLVSACEMLGEMAPSSSALSLLSGFATSTDPSVKQAALKALTSFSGSNVPYDLALDAANTSGDAYVLSQAVASLIEVKPSISWSLIQSALVTPSQGDLVVRTALSLIESGITEDRNLFGAIRPLLNAEHPIAVRTAALAAFARIDAGGQTVKTTTESWISADEYALRKAAITALTTYPEIKISADLVDKAQVSEPSEDLRQQFSLVAQRLK